MHFKKGRSKTGGRQRGAPNKLTGTFREALGVAYAGLGGHAAFLHWAGKNRTEFYKILAKTIPTEIEEITNEPMTITIRNFTECEPQAEFETTRPAFQAEEQVGQHLNTSSSSVPQIVGPLGND